MRVLTFLHSFEPGGVERIALRLVRHWRAQGVDAPLFMGRADGAMANDVGMGLDYTIPPTRRGAAAWETLWMIVTLPRAVRALRPDVLFCAGNTYAVVAVALKLLLGRACPPIVAKISNDLDRDDAPWPARAAYRCWSRVQGRFIDHFVGMETPMLGEIVEAMGVPAAAVSIVPDPALSAALIAELRALVPVERRAGRRFVSVGRLVPQKNIAMMVRAFHRGAAPDDHLTIIGDGPDRAALETLAASLNLAHRVDFRGYVANPASHLPAFDVLLLSSNYEGVPAAILEALAANLAIVATDCSRSMSTLLQHGALGTLVKPGDDFAFACAIRTARPGTQDPDRSLAQARRFTIEQAADAYLDVMAGVLRTRASPEIASIEAEAGDLWRRHNPQAS